MFDKYLDSYTGKEFPVCHCPVCGAVHPFNPRYSWIPDADDMCDECYMSIRGNSGKNATFAEMQADQEYLSSLRRRNRQERDRQRSIAERNGDAECGGGTVYYKAYSYTSIYAVPIG